MELGCRFCGKRLEKVFVDLGVMPLSNSFLKVEDLKYKESFYPLCAYVCESCFLVQLPAQHLPEEIFEEYAYFSSVSTSWLEHISSYVDEVMCRFQMSEDSKVIEVASNDGYLLRFFKDRGLPVLGIEPAKNVAKKSKEIGIPTLVEFFGRGVAERLKRKGVLADLLIANNVLAHVPDLNDFVAGLKMILKEDGVLTAEVPLLLNLIEKVEFDTIYHEHFSYFSFVFLQRLFKHHGFVIFDVKELPTHGGSIRIYASHIERNSVKISAGVKELCCKEEEAGLHRGDIYLGFNDKVNRKKREILKFLIELKDRGKKIVGYGAPAKGNILLNYCGIGKDFLEYVVDKNSYKQGLFLPGTHIPVFSEEKLKEDRPDCIIVMPWNLKKEIVHQIGYVREWGGSLITFIPELEVIQ